MEGQDFLDGHLASHPQMNGMTGTKGMRRECRPPRPSADDRDLHRLVPRRFSVPASSRSMFERCFTMTRRATAAAENATGPGLSQRKVKAAIAAADAIELKIGRASCRERQGAAAARGR